MDDSAWRPWVLGILGVMVAACGPRSVGTEENGGTGSTGSDAESSSSTTPLPGSSSSGDASTGQSEDSTTDDGASSSTGPIEPEVTCEEQECQRSCTYPEQHEDGDGEPCTCTQSTQAEGYTHCVMPTVCSLATAEHLCNVQALRYGIPGLFYEGAGSDFTPDVQIEVQILGDGRARELRHMSTHSCCGGASVDQAFIERFPVTVRPVDDPVWDACLTMYPAPYQDVLQDCWDDQSWAVADACEGPLDACPEVSRHVPGCDAECPMAGDGVCDEPTGTGLCAAGCDPTDCTCPDDYEFGCDEVTAGGTCPLGSDSDDCMYR